MPLLQKSDLMRSFAISFCTSLLITFFSQYSLAAELPLFFTGSACMTCTVTSGTNSNNLSYSSSCTNYGGGQVNNSIVYDPDVSQVMVNDAYYACTQGQLAPPAVASGCPAQQLGDNNWFRADNTNGTLVNIGCNVNAQLSFYGSATQTCRLVPGGADGIITYNCNNGSGGNGVNKIHFHPSGPQVAVNGIYYLCSTNSAPGPGDNPPADAATKAWFRADNNYGTLVNIACNIPVPGAESFTWSQPSGNVYQISTNMDGFVEKLPNMTVETAKKHADKSDVINFFYLGGTNSQNLKSGEAAFFSGVPGYQTSTGTTLYAKQPTPFIQNLPLDIYAYYSFNVNGNDNSAHNNDATLNDSVLFENGHNGNALRFSTDNAGAQVTLPALAYPQNTGFSIATWVRPDNGITTTGTNGLASIIGPLYFDATTNKIKYLPSNSSYNLESGSALSPGRWTHVAVTYSHVSNQATLYIDGNQAATATSLPALNFTPWGQTIGGIASTANPPYVSFLGAVDEVFLYERALSPSEIGYLAGFHKSNRHSAYPQSVDNEGQPGYKPKRRCEDNWLVRLESLGCPNYDYFCEGSRVGRWEETPPYCSCHPGTTANSPAGTGCSAGSTQASVSVEDFAAGGLPGTKITVINASHAYIQPTPRDITASKERLTKFKYRYCTGTVSSNMQTVCNKLKSGYGFKCSDLDISVNSSGTPLLNYPNFNIQEWANKVSGDLKNFPNFAVVNSNFWETRVTAPCGAPLGNLIETNGTANNYQLGQYDSLFLIRNSADNINTIGFYQKGTEPHGPGNPGSHWAAISGLLLRYNAENTTTEQMKNWPNGKYNEKAGRTAVGYDPSANTLLFMVLPPNRTSGTGLTAEGMQRQFPSNFTNVLLLDGGGSSTISYWQNGREQYNRYKRQSSGEKIRTLPTALIIAPTAPSN